MSRGNLTDRRKNNLINLKTDLEDVPISPKLNNWKSLSVSELINQPEVSKKTFSISSFAGVMKKGVLNTSNIISGNVNRTEADLTVFNTMEILSEASFTSNHLDTTRSTFSNKSTMSNRTAKNTNNTFKILVKEDYSGYIQILKRIYPSFRFNHYNKISNEYYEYYKKYGEEGDINNRNYISGGGGNDDMTKNNKNKEIYKKSNLLDILGLQENIDVEPKQFKIKNDFLSRKDPYELNMIKEDLSFKTSVIDKELNHILESEANTLYYYIENNIDLNKKIDEFSDKMKKNLDFQRNISKKYINNSSLLFLKENKKKNAKKLLKPLKILYELGKCMKELEIISSSENENKIKQISDLTYVTREKIKLLKKMKITYQKGTALYEIENKIQNYENLGEVKLNDQFTQNFEKLMKLCLIYNKDEEIYNSLTGGSSNENKNNYNLTYEKNSIKLIDQNDDDFELIDNNNNIYIKYLLIYNNNKIKNKIYKLLLSILEMFDIIIKDNMDISTIVDLFKKIFKKIISNNFEIIEKIPILKITSIEIISNCYSIILSNFAYIIQLVQDIFGLNGKKIFGEVIDTMIIEMDELVKALILAYLHEKMFENENEWKIFLIEIKNTKKRANIYLKNSKLKWDDLTLNLYQDYLSGFNEIKTNELREQYNNLLWDQITNINEQYQQMFDVLITQNINDLQIEVDKMIIVSDDRDDAQQKNDKNNETTKNEFLILKKEKNDNDKKHKISKFSYAYIRYLYEYLVVYTNIPHKTLKEFIISKIIKLTKDILLITKDNVVCNETGYINKTKQLTEKETALYYSDLIIIQKCILNFLEQNNNSDISNNKNELIETINSLKQSCCDIITQLITDVTSSFITEFNTLNFNNYKTFQSAKEYNLYIKKLTPLKRLYDNIGNAFLEDDIKKLFGDAFDDMFNKFKQCIINKGIIEKDEQLKQFRNEMNYLKKIFKLFSIIDCGKYKDIIDELSIKINPNKLPKKKKKTKHEKEEKEEDNIE